MQIRGGCHCGNLTFVLEWRPEPEFIPARACDCSFCVKHGGLWTSCPRGSLAVKVADPGAVSVYAFGTRTADFHVCRGCGVVPVVTSRIGERLYAVVSVHAFEGVDPGLIRSAPAHFGEETEAVRLKRRAAGWIPDVRFVD